jgi:hypothetical protein
MRGHKKLSVGIKQGKDRLQKSSGSCSGPNGVDYQESETRGTDYAGATSVLSLRILSKLGLNSDPS